MSFAPRAYQVAAIASLDEGWLDPAVRNQLLVMATGCGKTVVFSTLAKREADRGGRVLILAHTDELIDQAIDKYRRSTGGQCGKEKASSHADLSDRVVVGSVQTLQGHTRLCTWPKNHFTLVVVDEAHRSLADGYQKVLSYFGGYARVVGVTATADRGDKRALGEFYHRVAYDYGLFAAVRDGWLVRPIVKTMPVEIDLRGVKTQSTSDGQDLDRKEVSHRLAPFMEKIAQAIQAEAGTEKILLFLPSVETAEMMSRALNAAGVTSNWVCGDKKLCPDRTERVAAHKRGDFQALCNMAVLTEGYDDDTVRNIVCLRATKIRSLYCQIIGRGTRPLGTIVSALNAAPNAYERLQLIKNSGKPHVRVLDFLWLYEKHDLCTPASLVTKDEKLAELMRGKDGDLIEAQIQAERDLLKKLEDEVRKNARKKSTTVDPLAIAAELHDVTLANYQPETDRDAGPVSERQKHILAGNGVTVEKVTCAGHAQALITNILARHAKGLATVRQLNFFAKIGVDASNFTKEEASKRQQEQIAKWQAKRASKTEPWGHSRAQKEEQEASLFAEVEDFSEVFAGGGPNGG